MVEELVKSKVGRYKSQPAGLDSNVGNSSCSMRGLTRLIQPSGKFAVQ